MITKLLFSMLLLCMFVGSAGCIGPFSWRSNPPWLTTWMEEGELAAEVANGTPLGASREAVLEKLGDRGVKPFSEIADDGESLSDGFSVASAGAVPQFDVEVEYDMFPYLNNNYFIETEESIVILVSSYRATPPRGATVSWARAVGGEVVIRFEENKVHSVSMRPLDDDWSRARCPQFEIKSFH